MATTINGNRYDFVDVQIMTPGGVLTGIISIDYNHEAPIDDTHDNKGKVDGAIRKSYKASGSMEMKRADGDAFRTGLGGGYLRKPFTFVAAYTNDGGAVTIDVGNECVVTKETGGGQKDGEVTAKFEFRIKELVLGGVTPIE